VFVILFIISESGNWNIAVTSRNTTNNQLIMAMIAVEDKGKKCIVINKTLDVRSGSSSSSPFSSRSNYLNRTNTNASISPFFFLVRAILFDKLMSIT
jgi:hypothetical protein